MSAKRERTAVLVPIVLALILLAALGVRAYQHVAPTPTAPLFPDGSHLRITGSLDAAQTLLGHPLSLPNDLLDSEIHQIGIARSDQDGLLSGTTIVVLKKDHWRFAELIIDPTGSLDPLWARDDVRQGESIILSPTVEAKSFGYIRPFPRCIDPTDSAIGACQLSYGVAFAHEGTAYILSSDASGATLGELIEMSRSFPFLVDEAGLE